MSANKIKELENEIQILHDSIEDEQADLQVKREELKNLKDPKWEEKEEQQKIKEFLERAKVDFEKWSIEESGLLKNAYIEGERVMAFSAKLKVDLAKYLKVSFDRPTLSNLLYFYQRNYSTIIKLYLSDSGNPLIFHDGDIWGYLANSEADDEEEDFEKSKETESKKKTELEKIMELQELIDKAKNLIFTAQEIDCTIDYPYCKEIEIGKPNASISKQLLNVRSTLEWMDNMCWAYQGLKK